MSTPWISGPTGLKSGTSSTLAGGRAPGDRSRDRILPAGSRQSHDLDVMAEKAQGTCGTGQYQVQDAITPGRAFGKTPWEGWLPHSSFLPEAEEPPAHGGAAVSTCVRGWGWHLGSQPGDPGFFLWKHLEVQHLNVLRLPLDLCELCSEFRAGRTAG